MIERGERMSRRDDRERRKAEQLEKQKLRKVKQDENPDPKREPKSVALSDPIHSKLQWCFELFDGVTDWRKNVGSENHANFRDVASQLKSYSSRTWNEVASNKHRDHPVTIDKLCEKAKKRLRELKQDDLDELWRLRFTGSERIWGIRSGHVLRLLWWDPDHQVCPWEPKNT